MTPIVKNRVIIIESLLIIILIAYMFWFHGCHRPDATPLMGNSGQPSAPVQYKDAAGTVHTEIKVATADNEQIHQINNYYQEIIDSLCGVIKIQHNRITNLVKINFTTGSSFHPIYVLSPKKDPKANPDADTSHADSSITYYANKIPGSFFTDSTMGIEVRYNDPWLSLTGQINNDSSWKYSINEDLTLLTYRKRTGFLRSDLMLDVSSKNPNAVIKGLSGIKITPKPKKWSIGVQVGYYFNGITISPGIGLGISKTLIRF